MARSWYSSVDTRPWKVTAAQLRPGPAVVVAPARRPCQPVSERVGARFSSRGRHAGRSIRAKLFEHTSSFPNDPCSATGTGWKQFHTRRQPPRTNPREKPLVLRGPSGQADPLVPVRAVVDRGRRTDREERTCRALAEAVALVAYGRSRTGRQALARAIGGEPALAQPWLRTLITNLNSGS